MDLQEKMFLHKKQALFFPSPPVKEGYVSREVQHTTERSLLLSLGSSGDNYLRFCSVPYMSVCLWICGVYLHTKVLHIFFLHPRWTTLKNWSQIDC